MLITEHLQFTRKLAYLDQSVLLTIGTIPIEYKKSFLTLRSIKWFCLKIDVKMFSSHTKYILKQERALYTSTVNKLVVFLSFSTVEQTNAPSTQCEQTFTQILNYLFKYSLNH